MSYKKLVGSNLRRAFKQLKDLAVDVVFIGRTEAGFDFSTKSSKDIVAESIKIKAVVLKVENRIDGTSSTIQQLLLKTEDVVDIKTYDVVKIDGLTWKVGAEIFSDTYTTLVEITKQGA